MKNLPKKNYAITAFFVFLFFFVGISWFVADRLAIFSKEKVFKIGDAAITVEIADTPGKRAKGLSGRESLAENRGMLFVFDKPGYYSFWMKDMLIPLDFIWLNGGEIIQINENIRPKDYPPPKFFTPKYPADSVLEINAGTAKKLNIKIGDKISF